MLKIYTDRTFLTAENKSFFFPLLDEMVYNANSEVYKKYAFCEEITESDILILPLFLDYMIKKKQFLILAKFKQKSLELNKPFWVFIGGDLPIKFTFSNAILFKQVDFKSSMKPNVFITPVFIRDPFENDFLGNFTTIKKTAKPIVGYVGHAKGGFIKYLRTFYIFLKYNFDVARKNQIAAFGKFYPSSHIRLAYLKILERSTLLECNFILRDRYRAGANTLEERVKTTTEFFNNIKNSQYVFCIRGGGNFSVRLYETLAMGRIPLQIDTDCALPLENHIDWKKHALIWSEKEINEVPKKVSEFHKKCSEDRFLQQQQENRVFWKSYLTPANYFNFVHDILLNK